MKLLLHSPVGLLLADYDPGALRTLHFWPGGQHPPVETRDEAPRGDELGRRLSRELAEYFAGERRSFDLPLRAAPTPFQAAVRAALQAIPLGEVRSYAEVAVLAGRAGAARAVGQANARNPFPILVPCHRVLAADGKLGGYMGDWGEGAGLEIKKWLLEHEGVRYRGI